MENKITPFTVCLRGEQLPGAWFRLDWPDDDGEDAPAQPLPAATNEERF